MHALMGSRASAATAALGRRPTTAAAAHLPTLRLGRRAVARAPVPSRQNRPRAYASDPPAASANDSASNKQQQQQESFRTVEALIASTLSGGGGGAGGGGSSGNSNRWRQVEGSWVLLPPPGGRRAEAVVSFLGGAFVGAAPQLAYAPFLEALAARGAVVIATPYQLSFDQAATADRVQYDLERCMRALDDEAEGAGAGAAGARAGPAPFPPPSSLPIFGVGHSLGSLLHLLVCSRYPFAMRRGNILMSFNNKPATETIPFLSPLLAPGARALGPLLQQLATSPLRATVESALDVLRGPAFPPAVRQLVPVFDQLAPVMLDVASGRQEFTPAPAECRAIVRERYGVPRNLLLRFRDDTIDETPALAAALQGAGAAVAPVLDMTCRVLPGDHARPLIATANALAAELPPGVAALAGTAAAAGGGVIGRLADQAQAFGLPNAALLGDVGRGVSGLAGIFGGDDASGAGASGGGGGGGGGGDVSVAALADEIVAFMGIGNAGALPSSGAAASGAGRF